MDGLTIRLPSSAPMQNGAATELRVPDIRTALIVADINMDRGRAEVRDGDRLVAVLEREGRSHAPFWRVV